MNLQQLYTNFLLAMKTYSKKRNGHDTSNVIEITQLWGSMGQKLMNAKEVGCDFPLIYTLDYNLKAEQGL